MSTRWHASVATSPRSCSASASGTWWAERSLASARRARARGWCGCVHALWARARLPAAVAASLSPNHRSANAALLLAMSTGSRQSSDANCQHNSLIYSMNMRAQVFTLLTNFATFLSFSFLLLCYKAKRPLKARTKRPRRSSAFAPSHEPERAGVD